MGLSRLPVYPEGLYQRDSEIQVLIWLLTAAGSGVLGNATYDAVKSLLNRMRDLNKAFKTTLPTTRNDISIGREGLVRPGVDLRDQLMTIAHWAIEANNSVMPSKIATTWSEAEVYLLEGYVWAVDIRGPHDRGWTRVEIDLNADTSDEFSVVIFPSTKDDSD